MLEIYSDRHVICSFISDNSDKIGSIYIARGELLCNLLLNIYIVSVIGLFLDAIKNDLFIIICALMVAILRAVILSIPIFTKACNELADYIIRHILDYNKTIKI